MSTKPNLPDILKALSHANDKLAEINKAHKVLETSLKEKIEKLEHAAISKMEEDDVPSINTAGKTWSTYMHTSYRLDSVEDLRLYIKANPDSIHLLQGRVASRAAEAFIEEHKVPPPGVSTFNRRKIRSRKS